MQIRPGLIRAAVASACAAAAFAAVAAPTVYFGLDNSNLSGGGAAPNAAAAAAAFAAAAGPLATQNFDAMALGAVPPNFGIGAVTAGFTSSASDYVRVASGVGTFSTFAISGAQYLEGLTLNGSGYFTISLDTPVSALGFYITDASDWAGTGAQIPNLSVVLTQVSGTAALDLMGGLDPATVVDGNVAFFGVIDAANPITGFSIVNPAAVPDRDAIGLDNLQVSAVPVPGSAALLALGMLPLCAMRRRLQQA
ncbi:MAG: hypothetical protein JNJ60_17075 [Rhodocyclaceae bacterium]|nr:hypothetical protein [Rhodocyclaceae bacterium]